MDSNENTTSKVEEGTVKPGSTKKKVIKKKIGR